MRKNDFRSIAGIGTLICAVLLTAAAPSVHAEILYQWRESDGTLTFSPEPPPEGSNISFTVVKPDNGINPIALPESTDQPLLSASGTDIQPEAIIQSAQPEASVQLAYAPNAKSRPEKSDLPQGITAADAGATAQTEHTADAQTANDQALQASLVKKRQCGDLNKRIIALENQMSHSGTDADMDKAVLAMVRYQNSYDNYCGN